jgi:outer membrane protein OmpA-like peptidoglycan-associated protein
MRVSFYLSFLLLLPSFLFAQKESDSFTKQFTDANYHIEYNNFDLALPAFKKLLISDKENANLNYKVGLCYLKGNNNKTEALPYLLKAAEKIDKNYDDLNPYEKSAPLHTYLLLGQAYHLNYQLEEAMSMLEKYKNMLHKKHVNYIEAERTINMCKNAKEFIANPVKVEIANLGPNINSKYPEYSPSLSADESTLIFTSKREGTTGDSREINGTYFEDIYISEKDAFGQWQAAKTIGSNINTADHEASIGLSADGQLLFIYKGEEGGSIWMSELVGDEWSIPYKAGSDINSKYWETHAVISADNRYLYFVSDRPGGQGGRDIWMCKKLPNGMWALAQNLGPKINTPYDEEAPFIHPDGKQIFFSSGGHKTMGGFDIFTSEFQEDGTWSEPKNIGYPINTTDDDIYYVTSPDGKRAYLTSTRPGGFGEKDIYTVIFQDAAEKPLTVLIGYIKLSNGEKIPSETRVNVLNIETGESLPYKPNSSSGKYVLSLNPGNYKISYEMNDKEFHSEDIFVSPESTYNLISQEVALDPVTYKVQVTRAGEKPVELTEKEAEVLKRAFENLEFASGKDLIKQSSYLSLNELAALMKKHPSWKLKISGHTDNQGKAENNLLLSKKRALAVKKYLMSKGLSDKRFKTEWFGQTQPITDNNTEEGRQKNRRVEMLLFE